MNTLLDNKDIRDFGICFEFSRYLCNGNPSDLLEFT